MDESSTARIFKLLAYFGYAIPLCLAAAFLAVSPKNHRDFTSVHLAIVLAIGFIVPILALFAYRAAKPRLSRGVDNAMNRLSASKGAAIGSVRTFMIKMFSKIERRYWIGAVTSIFVFAFFSPRWYKADWTERDAALMSSLAMAAAAFVAVVLLYKRKN